MSLRAFAAAANDIFKSEGPSIAKQVLDMQCRIRITYHTKLNPCLKAVMNDKSDPSVQDPDFWAPRLCFREPIKEIFYAAELLDQAINAHLAGSRREAGRLIAEADMPSVWDWTESIWGKEKPEIHRRREVKGAPGTLDENELDPIREAGKDLRQALIERDGYRCRFCGIPVIRKEIRIAMRKHYEDELPWGRSNDKQHAAFQCMWMQFDHLLPHSRGGRTELANLVITCAPCNFGRMASTLEEVGLIDPLTRPATKTDWDGLERFTNH